MEIILKIKYNDSLGKENFLEVNSENLKSTLRKLKSEKCKVKQIWNHKYIFKETITAFGTLEGKILNRLL